MSTFKFGILRLYNFLSQVTPRSCLCTYTPRVRPGGEGQHILGVVFVCLFISILDLLVIMRKSQYFLLTLIGNNTFCYSLK